MTREFGRLALHTWTLDTTPLATAIDAARQGGFDAVELRRVDFARCEEAGMTHAQVLDLIRRGGMKIAILGVEYGWLFATGDESRRLFAAFRHSCEDAVALGCDMLMSAPGPTSTPIRDAVAHLKTAGDIAAEFGLRLAIEFNSQHATVNCLAAQRELIAGAGKPNCGLLLDAYHLTRSGANGRSFEDVPGADIFVFKAIERGPFGSPGFDSGDDVITDFSRSHGDKIVLGRMDANEELDGHQEFEFVGKGPFTAAGQLRWYQQNGDTVIEGNTRDIYAGPELKIVLDPLLNVQASDFIFDYIAFGPL